jgi:Flp pilus assembly protein TadG
MPTPFRRLGRLATNSRQRPRLGSSRRGQSLVEFALVLPMLLVLLLGIADFGRVFNAGITLEAATRDAAEAGAL